MPRSMLAVMVLMAWVACAGGAPAQERAARIQRAVEALKDHSSRVRERASVELVQLAPEVVDALPALTAALSDPHQPVRWNAARALGLMGPQARPAVPALAKAAKLADWSGAAQVKAAWALGRIGPAAADALPTLVEVLSRDPQAIVRCEVARTLGAIGPEARAALPALQAALADENGFVRVAAAVALWQVGQDARGVPVLVAALKDQGMVGARVAADALGEIGPGAREAVPALTDTLQDPAPAARVAAARALWRVARSRAGVPALLVALKDPLSEVRDRAAETLALIGREEPDPGAAEALRAYDRRKDSLPEVPRTLVFEAEEWTGPSDAIVKDRIAAGKCNHSTAFKGMSRDTVLISPSVLKDRATPEEGAPVLHTHITGIPNGSYAVTISGYRPLAVSRDGGRTWKKVDADPVVGTFAIQDGTFDLWVDDRYAHSDARIVGPSYYDTLTFIPTEACTAAAVRGEAKERVRERLGRGVSAARLAEGGVYVSWRLLRGDPGDVAFDLYRQEKGGRPRRVNGKPVVQTTDFVDPNAPAGECHYFVTLAGKTKDRVSSPPAAAAPADPPYVSIKLRGNYQAYQLGIADLDGDGRFDYVIKQPAYGIWNGEYLWHRSTETYQLEAYNADGRFLWRYDMGWGIELGPWHSPFIVHDLDGDGRAEVACKAAEADPRDAEGRVEAGAEYVAVLDGITGKVRCRAPWPSREGFTTTYDWLNQLCVAYLDGKIPCLIIERGTYGLQKVDAYQLRAGRLSRLWNWHNLGAGKLFWGQGAHTLHAADVDGDGRDEVVVGSSVLDDNGTPLWSTGYGHVDQCFVGDIDPLRPGLEVFYTVESRRAQDGACLADARTGQVIWGLRTESYHVGFGLVADIDPMHPGSECLAGEDPKGDPKGRNYEGKPPRWLFNAQGEVLPDSGQSLATGWGGAAMAAYWDGDLQRELVGRGGVARHQGDPPIAGAVLGVADLTGDWREEILTTVPGEVRIYATRIPANDRRVCLMQDPLYRLCVASNSQAYYSLPQTGKCLSVATASLTVAGATPSLAPAAENPCTVTVAASLDKPVVGTLRLSAGAGAAVAPARLPVRVEAGKVARFAFTVRPAVPSPLAGRAVVPVTAVLDAGTKGAVSARCALGVVEPPLSGVPVVEAEEFVEQSGGEVKVRADKVGVAGKAFSHWLNKGHRLAWQIGVPRAGRYCLVVRCSCEGDAERSVLVDGKAVPGAERLRVRATGGYGSAADEWANVPLLASDGRPAVLDLAAGEHRIVLESTDGSGLNMDQLALVPAAGR